MQLLDITRVETTPAFTLRLTFENGEERTFDMKPLLGRRPFDGLADWHRFAQARVEHGTVAWPGEIDVAPETLYEKSVPGW